MMMRVAAMAMLISAIDPTAAAVQPKFRAGVDLVTFGVTAVDRKGNLVTDLTQDDFQILEDGKPQTLRYFTRGLGEGEGPAAHLGLMLDTSGSMENELKLARSAAIKFLNMCPEARGHHAGRLRYRSTRHPLPAARFRTVRRTHPHAQT